jgi:hypothetical protein
VPDANDPDRLTALRRGIADGTYRVDARTLAEAVLARAGALVLWGRKHSYRRPPSIEEAEDRPVEAHRGQ